METRPTPAHISAQLSQNAFSTHLDTAGVTRSDGAFLPSNDPCEDRFSRPRIFKIDGTEWIALAVFDGHKSPACAIHLEEHLLSSLQRNLEEAGRGIESESTVQDIISEMFVRLDDAIIMDYLATAGNKELPLPVKMQRAQLALSGSCARVCLYDSQSQRIYTACVGDSRAVLGEQDPDGPWNDIAISRRTRLRATKTKWLGSRQSTLERVSSKMAEY